MLDTEAVASPIDLTKAPAAEIAEYLRPRLKAESTAQYFECPLDGRGWLKTLHTLPQAFIQSSRGAGQPSDSDKFIRHYRDKLDYLLPVNPQANDLTTGGRIKRRADINAAGNGIKMWNVCVCMRLVLNLLFVAAWKMLSQVDWKPMGYVSAFQSMLSRVASTEDYTEKTLHLDWWRFIVNPYNLAAAVRGKLMEMIMAEVRLALERCSNPDNGKLVILLEFLATAVHSLHALLLYNDRECDTESINEETRWPANVGLKTLASIGQIVTQGVTKEYMASYPLHQSVLGLQSAVAAFLARLSWNNDNKGNPPFVLTACDLILVL